MYGTRLQEIKNHGFSLSVSSLLFSCRCCTRRREEVGGASGARGLRRSLLRAPAAPAAPNKSGQQDCRRRGSRTTGGGVVVSCTLRAAYTGAAATAPLDLERRKRRGEEASCEKAPEELCESRRRCPCVRWAVRITTGDKIEVGDGQRGS